VSKDVFESPLDEILLVGADNEAKNSYPFFESEGFSGSSIVENQFNLP
jgi:hypothetical protein